MFKPTIGAADITYRSEAEAAMSFKLLELGIVSHDTYYPELCADTEGEKFPWMTDFRCQYTGILWETKSGFMNGLKTKANADKAMTRFLNADALGYIAKKDRAYKTLEASWSDSVQKFKATQNQVAEDGGCLVLVFDKKPDADTVSRLDRAKVFWCVYGDEDFRCFMSFRTLAKYGFRAEYTIKGHVFKSRGGIIH